VADSLEEAGDRLFTFTRLDPSQWKSARTTNAIERLNEEFKRRIKTQTVLPDAEPCRCCSGPCWHPARS
jgi:putative transposase